MAKPKPDTDWRQSITTRRQELIDRLFIHSASADESVSMAAIKTLLDLDPDGKPDPSKLAPAAPMFTLPTNTKIDLGTTTKDTH